MDEKAIIQKIQKGEAGLISLLIDAYQQRIFRICMGFVHEKDDAEDLTQEVFIRVFQSIRSFRSDSSFYTWISRIAINLSLGYLRKKKTRSFVHRIETLFASASLHPSTFHHPEAEMIEKEKRKRIHQAIESLPENQRIAFILSKYEELSQSKIAHIMQTSEGAVESLLQRAKKNLQKKLNGIK